MSLHVVAAEKSFATEEEAIRLYKELLRLGMVVRLTEERDIKELRRQSDGSGVREGSRCA